MCSRSIRTAFASSRWPRIAMPRSSPQQAIQWRPDYAVLADASAARELTERAAPRRMSTTRVLAGRGRARRNRCACREAQYVMAAIVGAAGLESTLAAARAGKRLLLANKESLVMAGPLLLQRRARLGCNADADGQRAQRDLPVPAARTRARRGAAGRAPRAADRLGRSVPRLADRKRSRTRHARGRPARIRTGSWAARSRWIRPRS